MSNSKTFLSTPSPYISYAQYATRLVKAAHIRRYDIKVIGIDVFEKLNIRYPLYKITINKGEKKKICVVSGVHGYEVAGPLALLQFLEEGKIFREYPDVEFTLFPMITPCSFDLKVRFNHSGRDSNALYETTLESSNYKEIHRFHQEIGNKVFDVFLSLHEDIDEDTFYGYGFEKEEQAIYRTVMKNVRKVMPIKRSTVIEGVAERTSELHQGLVLNSHDKSLEDYLFSKGQARLSLATETGMKVPLRERIRANEIAIATFADYLTESEDQ